MLAPSTTLSITFLAIWIFAQISLLAYDTTCLWSATVPTPTIYIYRASLARVPVLIARRPALVLLEIGEGSSRALTSWWTRPPCCACSASSKGVCLSYGSLRIHSCSGIRTKRRPCMRHWLPLLVRAELTFFLRLPARSPSLSPWPHLD